MWRVFFISSLLALMTSSGAVQSQEMESVERLMPLKMDYTQRILESIVKQEFAALREHCFRLGVLTASEDWQVIRTAEYNQHTVDFRQAVETLGETHKGEDVDSAALAYSDMTLKCVQCHKYVREYQTGSDQVK